MRQALTKLAAILTLSQFCLLYGSPLLLAYSQQAFASTSSCPRSCCHLAKTGSAGFASACCAVRCKEPSGERGSEPARTRVVLDTLHAPTAAPAFVPHLANDLPKQRLRPDLDSHPSADGQPSLIVKHSTFLV